MTARLNTTRKASEVMVFCHPAEPAGPIRTHSRALERPLFEHDALALADVDGDAHGGAAAVACWALVPDDALAGGDVGRVEDERDHERGHVGVARELAVDCQVGLVHVRVGDGEVELVLAGELRLWTRSDTRVEKRVR